MNAEHDLILAGCTPEPLLGYLKALGVHRLVALGADPGARACWSGDQFHLISFLDQPALIRFLTEEYRPTPIVAPWNGGSGFWDNKAAGKALQAVERSEDPRLESYRGAIGVVRGVIRDLGLSKETLQGDKTAKAGIIRRLRAKLPDAALDWLDASTVLTDDGARYAPILGSGGNDGNLDFSANFMQRLADILPAKARKNSRGWVENALFGTAAPPLLGVAIGQYGSGAIGGPNATQGFEGSSLVNPWDYVLLVEGALLLAGAAARRLGTVNRSKAAFPFTVAGTAAGWGTVAEGDMSDRGEIWLPLWDAPATFPVVRQLFAEGRAQHGRRQVQTGLDFARAVASLGVDRGIAGFQRYGFVRRNGLAYLAAPMGRLTVRARPEVRLTDQVEPWLERLRHQAAAAGSVQSLSRVLRAIDEAVFAYCEHGGPVRLQEVLVALGRAELLLATSPKLRGKVPPLHHLTPAWISAADDGSPEFRLAAAVASIGDRFTGAIRTQLEPVQVKGRGFAWMAERTGIVESQGGLARTLAAVLERRMMEADRLGAPSLPVRGTITASLADVNQFLKRAVDDARLLDLVAALATIRWGEWSGERPTPAQEASPELSRAYAALKLLFLPRPLRLREAEISIRPEPGVVNRLRAGRTDDALALAYRRLTASGLTPLGLRGRNQPGAPVFGEMAPPPERLAAALLVPIHEVNKLVNWVLVSESAATELEKGRDQT